MTSSLFPIAPLAILQADLTDEIKYEGSQTVCTQWTRMHTQPPASMSHCDSPQSPLFSFRNCLIWAESWELVSAHESTFSPDCWLCWFKHLSFLLTFTSQLLAFELCADEPELGNTQTESRCPLGHRQWMFQGRPGSTSPAGLLELHGPQVISQKVMSTSQGFESIKQDDCSIPTFNECSVQWKLCPNPFHGPTSIPQLCSQSCKIEVMHSRYRRVCLTNWLSPQFSPKLSTPRCACFRFQGEDAKQQISLKMYRRELWWAGNILHVACLSYIKTVRTWEPYSRRQM